MDNNTRMEIEEFDELDLVAGGAYTREQWESMSTAERRAAQSRSMQARAAGQRCELD